LATFPIRILLESSYALATSKNPLSKYGDFQPFLSLRMWRLRPPFFPKKSFVPCHHEKNVVTTLRNLAKKQNTGSSRSPKYSRIKKNSLCPSPTYSQIWLISLVDNHHKCDHYITILGEKRPPLKLNPKKKIIKSQY
jgi:hypothetical protein